MGIVQETEELVLRGLPISKGIGIGSPLFFSSTGAEIPEIHISKKAIEREVKRYRRALSMSRKDVEDLQRLSLQEGPPEIAAILEAHLEMMQDPLITTVMEEKIRILQRNSESIFQRVVMQYKERFQTLDDRYFQERLRDIDDISRRILHYLNPMQKMRIVDVPSNTIILAHELVPSETVEATSNSIGGFVTASGGITSHAAIIARAKGIPYVANVDIRILRQVPLKAIIVDGSQGIVIINPEIETLKKYQKMRRTHVESLRLLKNVASLKGETIDGYEVKIMANLENPKEIDSLLKQGAEGVGLFRSEYLFLSRGSFPSEEEQFQIYVKMVKKLDGRPLVIRVFDIGGDKRVEVDPHHPDARYFAEIGREQNPALGCRAIRFLLRFPEILERQLRAILRASVYGDIQILLPMVSDLGEFVQVRKKVDELVAELRKAGLPLFKKIPVGCMIEVPSSAIVADALSEVVDFLSIGTNDLIQYVMAADRNNPSINELYFPVHPSVLKLIRLVISAADRHRKPLILCGESAADPAMIPLLLGLGIREFSVACRHILLVKDTIRKWRILEACRIADDALTCNSIQELKEYLDANTRK